MALSNTALFAAAPANEHDKPHMWHGTPREDTVEFTPIFPVDSKDGLLSEPLPVRYSNRYQANEPSDADDDLPNTKRRSIFKTDASHICCFIFFAVMFYALGVLSGQILEMNDISFTERDSGNSYLQARSYLRAKRTLPKVTLGAYYYPWHADDFHRGDGYLRKSLDQKPFLGEYDDRDPKVIAQHLEWSERANIELWVNSWWGPYSREDNTTREVILTHPDLLDSDHKISLLYETFGRILEEEDYSLYRVQPDMEFMCTNYFSHPNYFQIDGKPVVYIYLTRLLEDIGKLPGVVDIMRQSVKRACGQEIYIIGDHIFGPPLPSVVEDAQAAFDMLDGVTNYDVYGSISKSVGSMGGYLQQGDVQRYYELEQSEWKPIVNEHHCAYIPSVSPGYNDLGVRPEAKHIPLSRSLFGDVSGSLFQTAVTSARTLVDSSASNVLMVNSFNEWHEDSQIEPVAGEPESVPFNLTYGLSYHGYGTLYLDILRSATRD